MHGFIHFHLAWKWNIPSVKIEDKPRQSSVTVALFQQPYEGHNIKMTDVVL